MYTTRKLLKEDSTTLTDALNKLLYLEGLVCCGILSNDLHCYNVLLLQLFTVSPSQVLIPTSWIDEIYLEYKKISKFDDNEIKLKTLATEKTDSLYISVNKSFIFDICCEIKLQKLTDHLKNLKIQDELDSKYNCFNTDSCYATWTYDDYHCSGCKHQNTRPGDN